jgi:hypothetical protein
MSALSWEYFSNDNTQIACEVMDFLLGIKLWKIYQNVRIQELYPTQKTPSQ